MKTGSKISSLRKAAGYSQEELAAKLEVSRQAVSRWETGEAMPDTQRIIALSRLFGVSTDYLLLDEVEKTQAPAKKPASRRAVCGIGLIILGVALILTAVILADVSSKTMTSYLTAYGPFKTALFRTWRAVFLYAGIALIAAGLWISLNITSHITNYLNKP